MKTNVIVNVKMVVSISHPDSAVETFVESLAKSHVETTLAPDKRIEVREIGAIAKGPVIG